MCDIGISYNFYCDHIKTCHDSCKIYSCIKYNNQHSIEIKHLILIAITAIMETNIRF